MTRIKDIAEKVNVSPSTVSIIINGKAKERKISPATQEKVLRAMKELNYIPNISAKTIRQGTTQEYIIALFCSFDFRNTMMTRFLSGIQEKITEAKDNTKVIIYPYQSGLLRKEYSHFTGTDFHAAVIANADMDDLKFLNENQFSLPIILYNRVADNYSSVNVDDVLIGRTSAIHLYEKGYRHPAIITGIQDFPGTFTRKSSFIDAITNLGIHIPENYIFQITNSIQGGALFAEQLLAQKDFELPDSVWCSSDNIALGFMNTMSANGIHIPENMGVISVGNISPMYSQYNFPPLTVIDIPIEEMGAGCYDLLKSSMTSLMSEPKKRFFETKLYSRASTNR